jgi:hypothetical protein
VDSAGIDAIIMTEEENTGYFSGTNETTSQCLADAEMRDEQQMRGRIMTVQDSPLVAFQSGFTSGPYLPGFRAGAITGRDY